MSVTSPATIFPNHGRENAFARIAALSTATPGIEASVDEVWSAVGEARGRRMPRLSSHDGAGMRWLAEPLSTLTVTRSQSQQTDAYLQHGRALARRVCREALERSAIPIDRIGLIIGTSCTGIALPSLDAELVPLLGLRADVARLPITELGCGAGLAGLARALDYLRAYPDRAVLVFSVELPSLTFQPDDRSADNLTAAIVFGDGAGAAVLDAGAASNGWTLEHTGTKLVPEGSAQLGFELRDGGLRVVLSRELPRLVRANLRNAVDAFLESAGLNLGEVDLIAAHPGGPRIFDAIEASLQLDQGALATSRRVFEQFGNPSSAGIFFVLEALPAGGRTGHALAIAFGPGLSIELALMRLSG